MKSCSSRRNQQRHVGRQHRLAVALGMQGVAVMVGVAHGVVERVVPARQRVHVKEQLVEPLAAKHRAVAQLVGRQAAEEGADRPVREQRHREPDPELLGPEQDRQRGSAREQGEVSSGLKPPLAIAAPHQLAQPGRRDRAPIPLHSQYRYISPEPLAIYLAHAALETYPDLLKSLPENLPSESARDAYFKRLASIASNPEVREYSRDQLHRFFFWIDDFVEPHAARRWSAIATADPELAAHNILRALNSSSTDDRRRITFRALGEIVRRLARIASRPQGFRDAARSLALLAEPENESWGNGASREFVAKYRVSLGGTALPYLQRLDVLDELIDLAQVQQGTMYLAMGE